MRSSNIYLATLLTAALVLLPVTSLAGDKSGFSLRKAPRSAARYLGRVLFPVQYSTQKGKIKITDHRNGATQLQKKNGIQIIQEPSLEIAGATLKTTIKPSGRTTHKYLLAESQMRNSKVIVAPDSKYTKMTKLKAQTRALLASRVTKAAGVVGTIAALEYTAAKIAGAIIEYQAFMSSF